MNDLDRLWYYNYDCEDIRRHLLRIIGEIGARLLIAAEVLLYGEPKI